MQPSKFFVFAYCFHEEYGGLNDHVGTCDSLEEAEHLLTTLQGGPYGYYEGAHIVVVGSDGDLEKVGKFTNIQNKGWIIDESA